MAKRKNHTAHNQTYKNHRNGIKKPKKGTPTWRGTYVKTRQNRKYALRNTTKWGKHQEKFPAGLKKHRENLKKNMTISLVH